MVGVVVLGREELLGKRDIPGGGVILDTLWGAESFWVAKTFWVRETFRVAESF